MKSIDINRLKEDDIVYSLMKGVELEITGAYLNKDCRYIIRRGFLTEYPPCVNAAPNTLARVCYALNGGQVTVFIIPIPIDRNHSIHNIQAPWIVSNLAFFNARVGESFEIDLRRVHQSESLNHVFRKHGVQGVSPTRAQTSTLREPEKSCCA